MFVHVLCLTDLCLSDETVRVSLLAAGMKVLWWCHTTMAGGGLLALVDDGQCIIFEQLGKTAASRTALNLSACCTHTPHGQQGGVRGLRGAKTSQRRLCDRVNTSHTAVADAEELFGTAKD